MSETATLKPADTKAPSVTFGFVKLNVDDLPAAVDFYARAFGLVSAQSIKTDTVLEEVLRKPGVEAGPAIILLKHRDGRALTRGDNWGPIGLYVRDVDAAYAYAISQGATPDREPWDAGAMRVAFVRDPEGHEIELVSMKR
jgi:lactoylglutathione lyase